MNFSGILVLVPPDRFEASLLALAELPGIDVHQHDAATGRIVVTQEAASVGAEAEGLRRIQALPDVLSAELVYHRLDDGTDPDDRAPEERTT